MAAHVEPLLLPFLRGELSGVESASVQAHVEICSGCRAALEDFRRIASDLGRAVSEPPPIHWGAYRAEIRDRLERRDSPRRRGWGWAWGTVPLRAAVGAGLIAILVYVGGPGRIDLPGPIGVDATLDEIILAGQLELVARLDLIQRLDLLENLDVIGGLDRLPPKGDG